MARTVLDAARLSSIRLEALVQSFKQLQASQVFMWKAQENVAILDIYSSTDRRLCVAEHKLLAP